MKIINLLPFAFILCLFANAHANFTPSEPILKTPKDKSTASFYNNSVLLNWSMVTDSNGGSITYDLYFGTTPDPPLYRENLVENWISPNNTEFAYVNDYTDGQYFEYYNTNPILSHETTYYWKVIAKNGIGEEKASTVFSFTTARANQLPTAPSLVSPTNGVTDASSTTKLEWTPSIDPDGDVVTYNVYFGTNVANPNSQPLVASGLTTASFITGVLQDQQTYYWRVEAVDGYNNQIVTHDGTTNTWQFTIENYINDAPALGTDFLPVDGANNVTTKPTLQWLAATDRDGDEITYDLYVGKAQNAMALWAKELRETHYQIELDDPYTTYYWKVTANDKNGGSSESMVYSFIPWDTPEIPIPIEMVQVEGGDYGMGSPEFESVLPGFESWGMIPRPEIYPQRTVTLNDFSIGKYEITYKQYLNFLNTIKDSWRVDTSNNLIVFDQLVEFNGSNVVTQEHVLCGVKADTGSFNFETDSKLIWDGAVLSIKTGFENYPMNWIYFKGAELFADWAGKRLPTEAEWEYAALGGNRSNNYIYSGTNTVDNAGWYMWNGKNPDNPMSGYGFGVPARDGVGTHEVGKKVPNELGIFDMSGNVAEICSDFYDASYYHEGYNFNPLGPVSGNTLVTRGGSWDHQEKDIMVKARNSVSSVYNLDVTFKIGYGATGIRTASDHAANTKALVYGVVHNENGAVLKGVALSSTSGSTLTDENGIYVFQFTSGVGTSIVPELEGYTFSPSSVQLPAVNDKVTDINFTAYVNKDYTISGTITDDIGNPIENVVVHGFPDEVMTDANGFYSAKVPGNWSYTLKPELTGYSFTDTTIELNSLQSDFPMADFTAEYIGLISIYGIVHRGTNPSFGRNGVEITGFPGESVITAFNGNYSKQVTKGWSGVLVPVDDDGSFFTPKELVVNNISEAINQTFQISNNAERTIKGIVKDYLNRPLEGVEIVGFNQEVTTGTNGEFSVELNVGWEGTIKAIYKDYSAAPATLQVVVLDANNTNPTFIMHPPGDYLIAGTVEDSNGNPLQGVTIHGFSSNLQTDIKGNYSVWVNDGYSGTITPLIQGYTFDPKNIEIVNIQNDDVGNDFIGTPVIITENSISGQVTDITGNPLPNVVLDGFTNGVSTNTNGEYSTTEDLGWSGTITPQLAGYNFNPESIVINDLQRNEIGKSFIGTLVTTRYTVSGRVTDVSGNPLANVTLNGFTDGVSTDAYGDYSTTEAANWSGIIIPQLPGYEFDPGNLEVNKLQDDATDKNFTGTLATMRYTVSGRVTDTSGDPLANVAINGFTNGVSTDAYGDYSTTEATNWSGTIIPQLQGYEFDPGNLEVNNLQRHEMEKDFIGTAIATDRYTISGQVTDAAGNPLANVIMNGFTDMVSTDENGNFSVMETSGWSGTITPELSGYLFDPNKLEITNLGMAMEQDFEAKLDSPEISKMIVFPNPSYNGIFTVEMPEQKYIKEIRIYNVKRLVYQIQINEVIKRYDVRNTLGSGAYVIEVITDAEIHTYKILVN